MNNRKSIRCAIMQNLLILTLLSFSTQSSAQFQNRSSVENAKDDEKSSSCFYYVAMVTVEVTDQQEREVADLRKDDFMIYEDGVEQKICYWKRNVGSDRQTDQSMYEAGYYPTNNRFEGEWRKIRIVVRGQSERKLNVQYSPKGYYAKKELRK